MAQHDFNIDNQSAPAFRGDLNSALEALGTLSSGATAPATTYANMLWYDTANNILKMRSEADDAWIALGTLDQSLNTFAPAGVAELTQAQAEDDTSTVFGQVSGQRLAQAVAANATGIGVGQTAQDLSGSRARFTVYQNTTDKPIWVCAQYQVGTGSIRAELFISADNVTFFVTGKSSPSGSNAETGVSSIVPVNFYYKVETNVDPDISELRWIEIR